MIAKREITEHYAQKERAKLVRDLCRYMKSVEDNYHGRHICQGPKTDMALLSDLEVDLEAALAAVRKLLEMGN